MGRELVARQEEWNNESPEPCSSEADACKDVEVKPANAVVGVDLRECDFLATKSKETSPGKLSPPASTELLRLQGKGLLHLVCNDNDHVSEQGQRSRRADVQVERSPQVKLVVHDLV